jgi:hypothetical protein
MSYESHISRVDAADLISDNEVQFGPKFSVSIGEKDGSIPEKH